MSIVSFQQKFTKEIPNDILGNAEYQEEVDVLRTISTFLIDSGIEDEAVRYWLNLAEVETIEQGKTLSLNKQIKVQERAIQTLRTTILRKYCGESYRGIAKQLARAPLYQWFCKFNNLGEVRIPGKSQLQSDENKFSVDFVRRIDAMLLNYAFANKGTHGLIETPDISECFFDTFCLETNIHYPTDWVLLRDASRTLMLAVKRIRKRCLVNRMSQECQHFITQMNKLCIDMTNRSRNKKSGGKKQKECFRKMKKLVKRIAKHADRHLIKLKDLGVHYGFTDAEIAQIRRQIENVLGQLPEAIRQGHERIIGGRQVLNNEKILSLYESDVNVIVRRKAGSEIEYGNKVSLMEQKNGLIIHWDLAKAGAPSDTKLCRSSYDDTCEKYGAIGALSTDRGCSGKQLSAHLKNNKTYDATCPRNPSELFERMKDENFVSLQKRRGGTEARISILKNFTGERLKCKGYEHRRQQFGVCVFTHNLWKLAKLSIADKAEREKAEQQQAA